MLSGFSPAKFVDVNVTTNVATEIPLTAWIARIAKDVSVLQIRELPERITGVIFSESCDANVVQSLRPGITWVGFEQPTTLMLQSLHVGVTYLYLGTFISVTAVKAITSRFSALKTLAVANESAGTVLENLNSVLSASVLIGFQPEVSDQILLGMPDKIKLIALPRSVSDATFNRILASKKRQLIMRSKSTGDRPYINAAEPVTALRFVTSMMNAVTFFGVPDLLSRPLQWIDPGIRGLVIHETLAVAVRDAAGKFRIVAARGSLPAEIKHDNNGKRPRSGDAISATDVSANQQSKLMRMSEPQAPANSYAALSQQVQSLSRELRESKTETALLRVGFDELKRDLIQTKTDISPESSLATFVQDSSTLIFSRLHEANPEITLPAARQGAPVFPATPQSLLPSNSNHFTSSAPQSSLLAFSMHALPSASPVIVNPSLEWPELWRASPVASLQAEPEGGDEDFPDYLFQDQTDSLSEDERKGFTLGK